MFDFFGRLWSGMLSWIGDLVGRAVLAVTTFLYNLFLPLVDLVGGFIYLLSQALDVVIVVVQIALYLVQVLVAVAGGIVRTLVNLATFDPAQVTAMYQPSLFAPGFAKFMEAWNHIGGGIVPLVLGWVWWMTLAAAVLYLFVGGKSQPAE